MPNKIRIRYHHLMCIPRYKGEGYSKEFCNNLAKVKSNIHADNYTLVDTCDDVCLFCPNNENGVCLDEKKVGGYDALVKEKLARGEALLPREICSDCCWFNLCDEIKI